MKVTNVQNLILEVLSAGPQTFETIFTAIEERYQQEWQHQAVQTHGDYDKLLANKRGEIYTLLVSDGYLTITRDEYGDVKWMKKEKLR